MATGSFFFFSFLFLSLYSLLVFYGRPSLYRFRSSVGCHHSFFFLSFCRFRTNIFFFSFLFFSLLSCLFFFFLFSYYRFSQDCAILILTQLLCSPYYTGNSSGIVSLCSYSAMKKKDWTILTKRILDITSAQIGQLLSGYRLLVLASNYLRVRISGLSSHVSQRRPLREPPISCRSNLHSGFLSSVCLAYYYAFWKRSFARSPFLSYFLFFSRSLFGRGGKRGSYTQ